MRHILLLALFSCALPPITAQAMDDLFRLPPDIASRWASFENPEAAKGAGGKANAGAKGAAYQPVAAGEEKTLLDFQGTGTIRRMWFTLRNREPEALRAYVLRIYWDGATRPAVEVPFGDFFNAILGRTSPFENALFSNPEGRSFNCIIPMPFRSHARITFTNESQTDLPQLYYDVDFTVGDAHAEDMLYFHAAWRRERWTTLARDFEILPRITGAGRFLGTHIGIIGHPDNVGWWGEGEVKIYLDGDTDYATLVGTGTEDYIGTAYGQGEFINRYQGAPWADNAARRWTFYRYHIPDPVYFRSDIRVTIQQMGGAGKEAVLKLLEKGAAIKPVSVQTDTEFFGLFESDPPRDIRKDSLPGGWTNMYRRDDVSAVALFYLNRPENGLPPIAPLAARTEGLKE